MSSGTSGAEADKQDSLPAVIGEAPELSEELVRDIRMVLEIEWLLSGNRGGSWQTYFGSDAAVEG